MSIETKSAAPEITDLPQGVETFVKAHEALYSATAELFAPYVSKHSGVARNFEQVMIKLRETGFWVNDALNQIMAKENAAKAEEQAGAPEA